MVNLWTIAEYHVKLWLIWKKFKTISQILTCYRGSITSTRIASPTIYTVQFTEAPLTACTAKGVASLKNENIFVIYPAVRISLGTTRHSGATLSFPNLSNRLRIGPPPFKIHELYRIWQYQLWSFKFGDTECRRF